MSMQRPDAPVAAPRPAGIPAEPQVANLAAVIPDPMALTLVPRALAERFRLVPIELRGDVLTVAMVDPGDIITTDEIGRMAGCRVSAVAANPTEIQSAISRLYT